MFVGCAVEQNNICFFTVRGVSNVVIGLLVAYKHLVYFLIHNASNLCVT
jgi:hypothetical protein